MVSRTTLCKTVRNQRARIERSSSSEIHVGHEYLHLRHTPKTAGRSNANKNHTALDSFLAPLAIVDFDPECAEYYGRLRSDLERIGQPIGPLDTMIAAHALRLRLPLVTNNTKEFARVSGLKLEDWST